MSARPRSGDVVIKSPAGRRFGNDGSVDTKTLDAAELVTTAPAIGFIRVRWRKLKAGQPHWRACAATSFDLVRAVRVGGKPRHRFVLGLGSQKNNVTGRVAAEMLLLAIGRMKSHGLDEKQRQALLAELIRKGARRPTVADVEGWSASSSWTPYVDELVAFLRSES
jgi:hypothetical protein